MSRVKQTAKTKYRKVGGLDASRPVFNRPSGMRMSKGRLLVFVLLYVAGWFVFYWYWRLHNFLRLFTSPEVEHNSFWIVFAAVNVFMFLVVRSMYRPETIKRFVLCTLLLLLSATVAEYFYVIPTILSHCHPRDPANAAVFLREVRVSTFIGILVRDFIIFSLILLGRLYRDALGYNKIKMEKQAVEQRNAGLQLRISQYMEHEHFTNNALASLAGMANALPEDRRKDFFLLLDIQRYSFSKIKEDFVSVAEEIRFVGTLLRYYGSRYPGLEVVCHMDTEEVPPYSVPPLLTEIPVSNMFKHGITEAGKGKMAVDFVLSDPLYFKMVCRNRIREDLALFDNPASRGISILQDRLDFLYGESASFTLTREGDEMVAVLIIPF